MYILSHLPLEILKVQFPNTIILRIKYMSTSYGIALMRMQQTTFDDKSKFIQVMAWWRQVTSH